MEKLRLFIAVSMQATPPLQRVLNSLDRLGPALRVVPPQNLHLTLRFLGWCEAPQAEPLPGLLQASARQTAAMTLRVQGLGAFPTPRRPAVVWAGLRDVVPLVALVDRLNDLLRPTFGEPDHALWSPHLTLARVKGPAPPTLRQLLQQHQDTVLGEQRVEQLLLMRSQLSRSGARYEVVSRVALG